MSTVIDMAPDIPDFSQFVVSLLGLAGISAAIVGFVAFAFVIQSWYGAVVGAVSASRTAVQAVRAAGGALTATAPGAGAVAILITILVVIAQTLTVYLCILVGSFFSMFMDLYTAGNLNRLHTVAMSMATDWTSWLTPTNLMKLPVTDWIALTYGLLAAVLMARSYKAAHLELTTGQSRRTRFLVGAYLLASPVASLVFLISPAIALAHAGDQLRSFGYDIMALCGAPIIAWLTYFLICYTALKGTRLVVRAWHPARGH